MISFVALLFVASNAMAQIGKPSCSQAPAAVQGFPATQCSNGDCNAVCTSTCSWMCGNDVTCTQTVTSTGQGTSFSLQCRDDNNFRPKCGSGFQPTNCPNNDCNTPCLTGCQFNCALDTNILPCKLIVDPQFVCTVCGQDKLGQQCCNPPCTQQQTTTTTAAGGSGSSCTTIQKINCANMLACQAGQEPQCFCDSFGIDTDLSYCGTPVTTGFGFSPAPSGPAATTTTTTTTTTTALNNGGGITTTTTAFGGGGGNPSDATTTAFGQAVTCSNQQLCDQWQGTPICVGGTCLCTADQTTVLSRTCANQATTTAAVGAGGAGQACDETRQMQCEQALKCAEDQTAVCLCTGESISDAKCADSAAVSLNPSLFLLLGVIFTMTFQ